MHRKSPIAGLVVLSAVLFVAAGVFCALFLVNRADPGSDSCLAAARMFADVTGHEATVGVPEGASQAVATEFVLRCET